jgi:uncharacterized protein (DUF58 family)
MSEPPIQVYFSGAKEIPRRAIFHSAMMRWAWRFYTQRLTQMGRWFFWPSMGFLMYGSITLDLQGYVPFCYCAAVWFFALLCVFFYQPRVTLDVVHSERVCAGETMPLDVSVQQRGADVPLVILPNRLPQEIDSVPEDGLRLEGLANGETARVRLGLRCARRGVFVFKGVRAECDYPFGLLRSRQALEFDRQILVYPRFTRLAQLELPSGRRYQPGGVALAASVGESFEYVGNREYRDGDNVRDIDWLATARLGWPVVREYREEYFLRVAVIMDTFVPKNSPPSQADAFEHAVSLAASVSDFMARQEYLVDLFAAGPSLYHLTTGRSLAYLDQILDILACVESSPVEPFDTIEPELMSNLARISTVICVFLDWDDLRAAFVRKIAEQGAAVKVIIVRDGKCSRDPFADPALASNAAVLTPAQCAAGVEAL